MKKDMALRGIGFAVLFNFIIVLVPITVGLWDIFHSTRPAFHTFIQSPYYHLANTLRCYSALGACPIKSAYLSFVAQWIIGTGILYLISLRFSPDKTERKQLLIWFIGAFPFASHLMLYPMEIILFYTETFRFGFV